MYIDTHSLATYIGTQTQIGVAQQHTLKNKVKKKNKKNGKKRVRWHSMHRCAVAAHTRIRMYTHTHVHAYIFTHIPLRVV